MLIDCHVNPAGLKPDEFAARVNDAGLDAVVITPTHMNQDAAPFVEAVEENGQRAFVGVELSLERGTLVFVPTANSPAFGQTSWVPKGNHWTFDAVAKHLEDQDGVLIGAHPYFRDESRPMGDGVYRAKGVTAIATRVGRGLSSWDRLAEQAASKRNFGRLGTCDGDIEHIGAAMTVLLESIENQAELVKALAEKTYMPLEFDNPAAPKDRRPPAPAAPRSGGRDDRRPQGRDGRGRGGRSRDDRPRRNRRD